MGNVCAAESASSSSSPPRATVTHLERLKRELKKEVRQEVKQELKEELKQELKEELKQELRDWIRNEIASENSSSRHDRIIKRASSSSLFDSLQGEEEKKKTSNEEDGADKSTAALSPVSTSTITTYKEILEELGFPGTDPISSREWKTAVLAAVRKNDLHAVEVLLDFNMASSVDDDEEEDNICIIDEAIERNNIEIAKALSKFGASSHLFVDYARAGDADKMKELLTTYAINPDSIRKGLSALQAAIRGGHQKAVELLIEYKASTDCRDGETPILLEALEYGHVDIAQFLVDSGVKSTDITLAKWTAPCGDVEGIGKWAGIASCNNKLFFCPCDASQVLVFDIDKGEVRTIDCGINTYGKWVGITSYGNKLFCAPHDAEEVLVINSKTEQIHTISLNPVLDDVSKKGRRKWNGIVRCGTQLYCAPYNASSILMIDGETERLRTISCGGGVEGERKWAGIAKYGTKLFCCPFNASSIMVFNTENENVYYIPLVGISSGSGNHNKWGGIVCYDTKLFCTPCNASSILVMDGDTEQIHTIPCGVEGDWKWSGIERFENKLVSSPFNASSIMIIDGETEELTFRPACNNDDDDRGKWYGIAQCGDGIHKKLVCSAFNSEEMLILEDYRNLLTVVQLEEEKES